ncbi:hypothetical protein HDU99_002951, partial [Rhizoclosmatium hyalinum]
MSSSGSILSSTSTEEHQFFPHTFMKPTFCQICNKFIWGIAKQGLQCNQCGLDAHYRCATATRNACHTGLKAISSKDTVAVPPVLVSFEDQVRKLYVLQAQIEEARNDCIRLEEQMQAEKFRDPKRYKTLQSWLTSAEIAFRNVQAEGFVLEKQLKDIVEAKREQTKVRRITTIDKLNSLSDMSTILLNDCERLNNLMIQERDPEKLKLLTEELELAKLSVDATKEKMDLLYAQHQKKISQARENAVIPISTPLPTENVEPMNVDWTVYISYCALNSVDAYEKGHVPTYNACGSCDPRKLAYVLTKRNLPTWLDIDRNRLQNDDTINDDIPKAILNSKCAVICASEEYYASEECMDEFRFIAKYNIPYVVILVGPERPSQTHWMDTEIGFNDLDALFMDLEGSSLHPLREDAVQRVVKLVQQ